MLLNTSINPAQAKTRNLPQVHHAHSMSTQLSTRNCPTESSTRLSTQFWPDCPTESPTRLSTRFWPDYPIESATRLSSWLLNGCSPVPKMPKLRAQDRFWPDYPIESATRLSSWLLNGCSPVPEMPKLRAQDHKCPEFKMPKLIVVSFIVTGLLWFVVQAKPSKKVYGHLMSSLTWNTG